MVGAAARLNTAAIPEAEAIADALVAVLRHQIQLHVPAAWLQAQVLADGGAGGANGNAAAGADGGDADGVGYSVEGTMDAVEQRVRSRGRTALCAGGGRERLG